MVSLLHTDPFYVRYSRNNSYSMRHFTQVVLTRTKRSAEGGGNKKKGDNKKKEEAIKGKKDGGGKKGSSSSDEKAKKKKKNVAVADPNKACKIDATNNFLY